MSFEKLHTLIMEKIKNDPEAKLALEEKIKSKASPEQLAQYFNVNLKEMKASMNEDVKIKAAHEIINEAFEKLSPLEREYVGMVTSNNKVRVFRQIKLIETFIPALRTEKEKDFALECLNTLKGDIITKPYSESVERTLELKHTIKTMLEAKEDYHGGIITIKMGNGTYLKDIRLAILHDQKDALETLYVTFTTPFYPLGSDFSSVKANLMDLDKRYGRMGRNILNATIYKKGLAGKVFTGEGLWDGGVRIHSVKPGTMSPGAGELTLHIVPGSLTSVDQAKKALIPVLKDLDALIPSWFPEVDKNAQKEYLKNPDPDMQDRLDNMKRTSKKATGDSESERPDEFGGAF
jgi:hypothetical protein